MQMMQEGMKKKLIEVETHMWHELENHNLKSEDQDEAKLYLDY